LVLSIPHAGTEFPPDIEGRLSSRWLARKDADWWIDRLYELAAPIDATIVRTAISRTVVDVNRDPAGTSLYPGQATTELCPTTTFDGEPLYRDRLMPDLAEIARRTTLWFQPYHDALARELARLRVVHERVVLYDCHSIRSFVPRLFDGLLPHFNLGTNNGASCAPELTAAVAATCEATSLSSVVNGRFTGGWITRNYGSPPADVHAIQMELACRSYLAEPIGHVDEETWPAPFDAAYAAPIAAALSKVLQVCTLFAAGKIRGAKP